MGIREANESDIEFMVGLSYKKRKAYEKAQPRFWKYTKGAEKIQSDWFRELLPRDDHIILIAENSSMEGFVIGRLIHAPEVYNPGGLTLMIDDFCVNNANWQDIGSMLLHEIRLIAKKKGAAQILIVSGAHDKEKLEFLISKNLSCASCWYVGDIG